METTKRKFTYISHDAYGQDKHTGFKSSYIHKYLLSYQDKAECHILSRNVASQKAFYSLQGAGIKHQGISPE